ncbi:MAG: glycosyltransferase family 2 protein [Pirellulales bacterium]
MIFLAVFCLLLSLIPLFMTWENSRRFQKAIRDDHALQEARKIPVSVLIPARNEELSIERALKSLLESQHETLEIWVYDDASEDRTAAIVDAISHVDPRVRRYPGGALPQGWNGKQHACFELSKLATYEHLLFLDADVRVTPDAITRAVAQMQATGVPLLSGFPRQETVTLGEQLLLPMMYVLLLGYLPIQRMRTKLDAGLAAGCGQFFLAQRAAYRSVDGHRSIAASRHDGIQLPRAFRKKGLGTDIFDASDIAICRMYHNWGQVVRGLLKNATEGIANPKLILVFTLLLGSFSWIPALIMGSQLQSWNGVSVICLLALGIGVITRLRISQTLGLALWPALVHPMSVTVFVLLQWIAFGMAIVGKQLRWRGRI